MSGRRCSGARRAHQRRWRPQLPLAAAGRAGVEPAGTDVLVWGGEDAMDVDKVGQSEDSVRVSHSDRADCRS